MAAASILKVVNQVDENINVIMNANQDVRDDVNNLGVEVRAANRSAQAVYTSVYRSLDDFINLLTISLALCQNRSRQYQRFVKSQFHVVSCRR